MTLHAIARTISVTITVHHTFFHYEQPCTLSYPTNAEQQLHENTFLYVIHAKHK